MGYGINEQPTKELLRKVDVGNYGLELGEQVAAAAVKAHLCGFERQQALEMLRRIMKATVLKIPPLHQKPELLQTKIEGKMLADLIDTAAAEQIQKIKEAKIGEDEMQAVVIKALEYIDGKKIVEDLSPEFLGFLTDCYKELRY